MTHAGRDQRHRRRLLAYWLTVAFVLGRRSRRPNPPAKPDNDSISSNPTAAPSETPSRALFFLVVALLVGSFVGFGVAGYDLRPADSGPPAKPKGAVQFIDLVVDHPDIDAAVRLSLDSTHDNAPYVQIALGIDTPRTTVRWALVICLDGRVDLHTMSSEPTPVTVRPVLPAVAPVSTYLLEGSIAKGSTGYTSLHGQVTTQSVGDGVYPITLLAQGLHAAAYEGPYLTIPVAAGVSETFRTRGVDAVAPSPQQLLRALDQDSLGWNPVPLRNFTPYQSNALSREWTPDGLLLPQAVSSYWYWDLSTSPRSSVDYATARSPAALVRQERHVFWSGVLLALSGSALLALIPLTIAWPRRRR